MIKKILYQPFFIRLFNWEYWPFHVVYLPIYFYWCWLCIRSRSFFFFNTANPGITNGGFLMESKMAIYNLLPEGTYPSTVFFKAGSSTIEIINTINSNKLQFPLVGKPDIGMQGLAVQKLDNMPALLNYARSSSVDFLVQEFVPFEKEAGIFYYRMPGVKKGRISGIVSKEFLSITGDGVSTILTLLKKDKRYILQLSVLKKMYGEKLHTVLPTGEEMVLVPYGNHVRGAKFVDVSHLADESLVSVIDKLCNRIDGFYFGRMDIRYRSWEDLREGKHFSIIELNGAGSEPTHMYDPRHTVFFAWKEIIRHINILFTISRINHRLLKKPYMSTAEGLQMLRENKQYVKRINGSESRAA
ncbi:MAG: D-alanine--D-alanine ligase [Bacteroidetes bacterium]|nr:D-alanine--D-alanine ligase [Bacteroidota bacterium]